MPPHVGKCQAPEMPPPRACVAERVPFEATSTDTKPPGVPISVTEAPIDNWGYCTPGVYDSH